MSSFFVIILIGISLSMDAFSIAIIYGIIGIPKKEIIVLSSLIGIFHFIMPLIGLILGILIENISFINLRIISAIILIYIGIDLIVSNIKKEENLLLNKTNMLIFALSVSLDSLTIGIGLKAITSNYIIAPLIFSICSTIFTYLGLILGSVLGKKVGKYSKIIGGLILIIIASIMFTS